jgi:hypothetical protein
MAEFVPGLLGLGAAAQLAQTVADLTKNLERQLETQEKVQQGYNNSINANATAVYNAGCAMADVEEKQATQAFMTAGGEMATPIIDIGQTAKRDQTSGMFAGEEQIGMAAEKQNLGGLRNSLENGNVSAEARSEAAAPGKEYTNEELEKMAQKPIGELTQDDKDAIGTLKTIKNQEDAAEVKTKSRLYRRMDKKIQKAEESLQNQQSRYNAQTDRRSNLLASFGRASASFLSGGGSMLIKQQREKQAEADRIRTIADGTKDIQRTAQDGQASAIQGTLQTYTQQIDVYGQIARANSPV